MTDSLNTPEKKAETLRWLQGFHAASDSLDSTEFVQNYFTEDAVVQFGNNPVVKAHGPFIEIQSQRLKVLESMSHEVVSFDILPDKIYQVASVTYKVKNDPSGEAIVIPGLAVFYKALEDSKINRFEVYIDISPVFKRAQEIAAVASQV
ncbi:hypothetical protein K450DRAFT_212779, partial [Umbelopsis ramanniana AG]